MKKLLLLSSLLLSTTLFASHESPEIEATLVVEEITAEDIYANGIGLKNRRSFDYDLDTDTPAKPTFDDRVDSAGKVITAAGNIVALGESIYTLVTKGKPKNTTEYAPINVVPKDPSSKEQIDVFDLEGFSMPVEKSYVAKIIAGGKEVVNFTYKVMFSYGGSYNGAGKYLMNVIVIPGSVKTSWGWEFNATMKLSGVMNHGTKADPVAGIMVTMKYKMDSLTSSFERNDTIHITGRGEIKNYMVK